MTHSHETAKKVTVRFWATDGEREPVRDLISDLSKDDKKLVGTDLKLVELGWPVGMPTCRPMGDGLHEVRTTLSGNRELRVLFFVDASYAVLLHAFFKKTRATPKHELDLAKKRMSIYRRNA